MEAAMVMAATAAMAVLRMVVIGLFPLLSFWCLRLCVSHVDVSEDDKIVIKGMCNPSYREFDQSDGQVRDPGQSAQESAATNSTAGTETP